MFLHVFLGLYFMLLHHAFFTFDLFISCKLYVYLSDELLAKEVANLDEGASLSDGTVDGEMRVHGAHFVQVALKNVFH